MKFNWREIYILPHITHFYLPSNTKFSVKFCFWIRRHLFFKWKIHYHPLFLIKKKRQHCISLVNVPLWFTSVTTVSNFFRKQFDSTLFGLWSDDANHDEHILNHVILIFRLHMYNSKGKQRLNIINLLNVQKKWKKTEHHLSSTSRKKKDI